MKLGEEIQGYRIVTKPTNSGGGRCVWAFAERDGSPYFIKQFLDPKWPTETAMGSPAGKELRREACREFEERHRQVNSRINPRAIGGGNLVAAVDFFRHGSSYYKVTDRIDAIPATDLRGFDLRRTAVVLRTLCHSIRLLHRAGIVHGDLKPDNVLLQRSGTGDLFTAKVIDFDDSYPSGEPPPPDQVVGDQRYGAPEWLRYVKRDPAVTPGALTTAADVFALGLVFHVYLTGSLPGYDSRFGAPAEAVWAGEPLQQSRTLHPAAGAILGRMTSATIADRPSLDELLKLLADDTILSTSEFVVDAGAAEPAGPSPRGGRLKFNLDKPASTTEPAAATPPAEPTRRISRVRSTFDR